MDVSHDLTGVRAELGRADTKASTLLGLAGTAVSVALAVVALGTSRLTVPAQVAIWAAVALLAVAVAVLLLTVRPALPRPGAGAGWIAHAYSTPDALAATAAADAERAQLGELIHLSRLARAKYARIRVAVDLLLAALTVAVVTTALIIAGGAQ